MSAMPSDEPTPWVLTRPTWHHRPTFWLTAIAMGLTAVLLTEAFIWPPSGHWGPGSNGGALMAMLLAGVFSMVDRQYEPPKELRGGWGWAFVCLLGFVLALDVFWITFDFVSNHPGVHLVRRG